MKNKTRMRYVVDTICGAALILSVILLSSVAAQQLRHSVLEEQLDKIEDTVTDIRLTVEQVFKSRKFQDIIIKYIDSLGDSAMNMDLTVVDDIQVRALLSTVDERITVEKIETSGGHIKLLGYSEDEEGYQIFVGALNDNEKFSVLSNESYLDTENRIRFVIECDIL